MKISFISNGLNKLKIIVISCFIVAGVLIAISFYIVNRAADNCRNMADVLLQDNIINPISYNLEYEIIVYGNKTTNRYKAYETYKKESEIDNEYFKIRTVNEDGVDIMYEINGKNLNISSSNSGPLTFYLEDYNVSKINLYSLSTFIDLYYNIKRIDCNCENYIYKNETDTTYLVGINIDNSCELESGLMDFRRKVKESGMDISKVELEMSKKDMKPIKYIAYDSNGKAYFEITYENVEFN